MEQERENTPKQIDENNRNALVYIEIMPNNILVLPWRIKKFFTRDRSVTNISMHNTFTSMHKDAEEDTQKIGVAGTGFFIAPDLLVTNIHVVANAKTVAAKHLTFKKTPVYHPDHKDIPYGYKRQFSKKPVLYSINGVVAFDAQNDLVVLKVNEKCATHLPLSNSDNVHKEHEVFTLSYANANYKCLEGTIHGWNERNWFEIETQYTPGISGSPVLNTYSEVIGIACLMSHGLQDSDHKSFMFGSAIPSNLLKNLLEETEETEEIEDFAKWQKRPTIRAYALLIQTKLQLARGKYKSVIKKYDRILKLNPHIVFAHSNRGAAKNALGKHIEAIEDYNEVIQLYPDYTNAYINRGRANGLLGEKYDKQGKLMEAREYYHKAMDDYIEVINQDPKRGIAYNSRGWTKYLLGQVEKKEGNQGEAQRLYQEAITDADEALRLQPEGNLFRSSYYHTRGAAKAALDNHHEAIKDFDESINLNPDKALLYQDRGLSNKAIGLQTEADADFAKAKELDPKIDK